MYHAAKDGLKASVGWLFTSSVEAKRKVRSKTKMCRACEPVCEDKLYSHPSVIYGPTPFTLNALTRSLLSTSTKTVVSLS